MTARSRPDTAVDPGSDAKTRQARSSSRSRALRPLTWAALAVVAVAGGMWIWFNNSTSGALVPVPVTFGIQRNVTD